MNIKQLIYRNLKKNIQHYFLYIFALIFSVALYFAFVTLQYDPAMDDAAGTVRGAAGLKAASVLLIAIVSVFLLYANTLFIKRRGKEIGLFQLIGMTKGAIFRILSVENIILYFGSVVIGVFLGFSVSKLLMMMLFRLTGVEDVASLHFSPEALVQTVLVFTVIYVLLMIMNAVFIKRQTILALFRVTSTAQLKIKRMSIWQAVIGILGIAMILFGYYLSSKLFSSDVLGTQLFLVMITILFSTILGTYFFYKGSVSFIFNLLRKRKGGYLNVNDVLSLSSIMFRMKSNSFLLTVITTASALAIGLLSLSYISYYSAEKTAEENIPDDFGIPNPVSAEEAPQPDMFMKALDEAGIEYTSHHLDLQQSMANLSDVIALSGDEDASTSMFNSEETPMIVISDEGIEELDAEESEVWFVNKAEILDKIIRFKDQGELSLSGESTTHDLEFKGFKDINILPARLNGAFPVAVVDQLIYEQLAADTNPDISSEFSKYTGVNIKDNRHIEQADEMFHDMGFAKWAGYESQYAAIQDQKMNVGLTMFIVGFLGLAFLITSGCILYFKQMDESEDEKPNYTILRKLGFTQADLIKGISIKQIFNFGIPLIIGLSHSYFAVKSGWFFFGTEMVTPMIIVMLIYTGLYSIFGMLSVLYYKRVIREAL
ncbi:Bacitracin export permease protein BceB [Lentibacillus sp. JNUCC-1]|uniref:FtsX-like permease family protein n=1 Tax=Lentibacillus sp. JNUCC-1 TaxID=2654513 RepID=UPI0012E89E8C|nr:ABC transporter permease [Lentibacillus sp. JNUCC-1]MUV36427.1 Bacitracin export permease protein BceB [Lentibacillus sp. JNUCC-1]